MPTIPSPLPAVDLARMRADRLDRARAVMRRHDLAGVLAFEYANGRYVADLRPLWAPNFLVRQAVVATPDADRVIVFVHQDDTPHRRATMPWIRPTDVREFPTGLVADGAPAGALGALTGALAELGAGGGRIGVDIATPSVLDNLRRALPGYELVDSGAWAREVRAVKQADELELMRFASQVSDRAMGAAIAAIAPGVRECDVLAVAMDVFYRHAAEVPQCNLIVCSGPNTMPMQRYAGDRAIEPGDLVMLDLGACFFGLFSELARTVVCGTPNAEQRAIYGAAFAIHEATIGALVPGASPASVQAAAAAPYATSAFAGRMQRMIVAHGIGVGYAEPPFVPPPGGPPGSAEPFGTGVTLAVVPTLLVPDVPGGGGVRIEDVVHLGPDGPERLTTHPYDQRLLA